VKDITLRSRHILAGCLATTALVPISAIAEEDYALDEITVLQAFESPEVEGYAAGQSSSATKTSTPLVKTPVTVNVVTEDQMLDQAAESVAEALSYTPNVVTNYRGESTIYDETFIRGFTYAPKYLNGSQFGTSGFGQLDPFLLDRVEVVKGPNSVVFGSAIPGGVVNMSLKTPNENTGNRLVFGLGSDNYKQLSADLRGDLNEGGTLKYRLAVTGWDKDLQGDAFGQSRLSLAPSIRWEITPDTELQADVIYQKDPEAGQRNFYTLKGTLEPTVGGHYYDRDLVSIAPEYDQLNRETYSFGTRLRHSFDNGMTFRSSLRYTEIDQFQNNVLVDNIDSVGVPDDIADLGVAWIKDDYTQFTFDNSLESQFAIGQTDHTLLVGLDYQQQKHRSNNRTNWVTSLQFDLSNPSFITPADDPSQYLRPDNSQDVRFKQTGLYVKDQIAFGRFNLLLGGRYDWTKTTTENLSFGGSDTANSGAFSGRIGLSYEFDNGIVPYASFSTSFQPSTDYDVNGNLLDPSDARQFEVGAKWASADDNLFVSAAYFDIEQTNIVEDDPVNGWPHRANIGTRRSKGFELEARGRVTDRLDVIAGLGLVDAQMTEGQYAGFTAQRIPESNASLWLNYEFIEGLSGAIGARYTGSSFGDYAENIVVPSYTLFDLGISADLGLLSSNLKGVKANLAVTNLTDETYVASCVSSWDDYCWFGEGREVRFQLTYDW
jgi:iron complex outermembrane receptor protein